MKNKSSTLKSQGGSAAVELALVLPLFNGQYFLHYIAAQKATQDAARYLFDMLGLIVTGRYGIPINAVSVMNYVGN